MQPSRCCTWQAPSREKALWYAKLWYALFFGSCAFIYPYINLFFMKQGYTPSQIGVIAASRVWVGVVAGSAWSALADAHSCHRLLMTVLHAASTFLPSVYLYKTHPFAFLLTSVLVIEVLKAPIAIIADAAVASVATGSVGEYGMCRMWGAVAWGAVSAVAGFILSTYGFGTTIMMFIVASSAGLWVIWFGLDFSELGSSKGRGELSRSGSTHKLQGSCGSGDGTGSTPLVAGGAWPPEVQLHEVLAESLADWETPMAMASGSASPALRLPQETYGHPGTRHAGNDYDSDAGSIPGSPCDLESARLIRVPGEFQASSGNRGDGKGGRDAHATMGSLAHSWRERCTALLRPPVVLFLVKSTLMGYGMGTFETYMFLYLSELGAPEHLMGLAVTATCVSEVPVFRFSGDLLAALGARGAVHLVLAAFVVRLVAYSTMGMWPTPWLLLPIELLHGLTFGLAWAVGTAWAAREAPRGLEATMQAAFSSAYFGVGTGLGSLAGGVLYVRLGPATCFLLQAGVIAAGWAATSWGDQCL